jgi:hypothetical protein
MNIILGSDCTPFCRLAAGVLLGLSATANSTSAQVTRLGGQPREEWRYDGVTGVVANLEFVPGIAILPDRRIVFLDRDPRAPQLVFLSEAGVFERSVGRRGAGPGEFQSPTGLAVDPRGRVIVHDLSNARISTFSSDGVLIGTVSHRRRPALAYNLVWDGSFDRDGRLHISSALPRRSRSASDGPDMFGDSTLITEVWRDNFSGVDTLAFCSSPPPVSRNPGYVERRTVMPVEGGRGVPSVGYVALPLKLATPPYVRDRDGAEWGSSATDSMVLVRRRPGVCNSELARLRLRAVPSRVPDAELSRERMRVAQELRDRVPRNFPPFQSLHVDEQNRLWVARGTSTVKVFEIFTPDGKMVEVLPVPSTLRLDLPFAVARGRVVGFTVDEDGARALVSWRYM